MIHETNRLNEIIKKNKVIKSQQDNNTDDNTEFITNITNITDITNITNITNITDITNKIEMLEITKQKVTSRINQTQNILYSILDINNTSMLKNKIKSKLNDVTITQRQSITLLYEVYLCMTEFIKISEQLNKININEQ